MKITFETEKNLQSKAQEAKIRNLINRFNFDLEKIGIKVISFELPSFREERI